MKPHKHAVSHTPKLFCLSILAFGLFSLTSPAQSATLNYNYSCNDSSYSGKRIFLSPGDDISAAVEKNPENTAFLLAPGVYTLNRPIVLKSKTCLLGPDNPADKKPLVTLSGTRPLAAPTGLGNGLWMAAGTPIPARPSWLPAAECRRELCDSKYALIMDGQLLLPVASKVAVVPGTFYADQATAEYYFTLSTGDAPKNHTLEQPVTISAILPMSGGNGVMTTQNVTIANLAIYGFNTYHHFAALQLRSPGGPAVDGAVLRNLLIQNNMTIGAIFGPRTDAKGLQVIGNGQSGLQSNDLTINSATPNLCSAGEIANRKSGGIVLKNSVIGPNNNALYFSNAVEGAGAKFVGTNIVVENNVFTNNHGAGFWTDMWVSGLSFKNNYLIDNEAYALHFEISNDAVIDNNIFVRTKPSPISYTGEIYVSASGNTKITSNTFVSNTPTVVWGSASMRSDSFGLCTFGKMTLNKNTIYGPGRLIGYGAYAPNASQAADPKFKDAIAAAKNAMLPGAVNSNNNVFYTPLKTNEYMFIAPVSTLGNNPYVRQSYWMGTMGLDKDSKFNTGVQSALAVPSVPNGVGLLSAPPQSSTPLQQPTQSPKKNNPRGSTRKTNR